MYTQILNHRWRAFKCTESSRTYTSKCIRDKFLAILIQEGIADFQV